MAKFELKEFVSIEDQLDLVGLTVEQSFIDGILNPMLLGCLYDIHFMLVCTDIQVEDEDKLDKLALYDKWVKEGVIRELQSDGDHAEMYEELWSNVRHLADEYRVYNNSFAGLINKFKNFADAFIDKSDKSLSVLESLNPETISQLKGLADTFGVDLQGVLPKS